jgi:uncharacterized protein (DUF427 family)
MELSSTDVTMVKEAIHNPSNPLHFMRLKSCTRTIRIWKDNDLIAETNHAIRLMEIGRDMYDPVFYVPKDSVIKSLNVIADQSTHCPLKGDASYYSLEGEELPTGQYLAWSYDSPLDFASELKGYIAFNADMFRFEEFST